MLTPTNRAALPVSSEPPDTTLIPTNTPKLQPQGATPIAPAAPSSPAAPALPLAPQTGGDVKPPAPAPTATAGQSVAQSGERSAPMAATPAAPSPYQTSDPLAFMPAPTGSTVTEGPGLLPPDVSSAAGVNVPAPIQAPVPTTGGSPSYGLTPTTPQGSLLNSTITPGAGTDRYAIANDLLKQWDANEQPQFERQIQDLSQNAAARGQIGSGMARGSFRDALTDEQTRRTTAQAGFLDNALTGSIDDAYKNVAVAQQQQGVQIGQAQQGFNNNMSLQQLQDSESGQQWTQLMQSLGFNADQMQKAFDNAYKVQQLSDDETGQAFSRALQEAIFGASGDPTQIEEYLAGLYALPQGATTTVSGGK